MTNDDAWNLFEEVLQRLCTACNNGKLVPVLEADVVGYTYYLFVEKFAGDSSRIHLDTRLYRAKEKEKCDLVIGDVFETAEQKRLILEKIGNQFDESLKKMIARKSTLKDFRPVVIGQVILEFKHFALGFDPGQLNRHLEMALGDLNKLATLKGIYPKERGVVLFDDNGYLNQQRLNSIVEKRNTDDPDLRIYLLKRNSNQEFKWELV